jgi:putative membrane protein
MKNALTIIGSILIFLATVFHLYVFKLETLTWRTPKTWKTFGLPSQEHADIIAPMAYNQGFYNLFLAIGAGTGLVMLTINTTIALTLILASSLSMVGAGAVLFFSVKRSRPAAMGQAGPALLGVLALIAGQLL